MASRPLFADTIYQLPLRHPSHLIEQLLTDQVERLHALFGATEHDGPFACRDTGRGQSRRLSRGETSVFKQLRELSSPRPKNGPGMCHEVRGVGRNRHREHSAPCPEA